MTSFSYPVLVFTCHLPSFGIRAGPLYIQWRVVVAEMDVDIEGGVDETHLTSPNWLKQYNTCLSQSIVCFKNVIIKGMAEEGMDRMKALIQEIATT